MTFTMNVCISDRCVHEGQLYPQIIHPSQFSLILSPPADCLMNTHFGPVETLGGDTHFCRPLLQDPVWNRQHLFNPPVHIV